MPTRSDFEDEAPAVLRAIQNVLAEVVRLRRALPDPGHDHQAAIKAALGTLGTDKKAALHRLRILVGQEQGLPVTRFLMLLPLSYLGMIDMILAFYLENLPVDFPAPSWEAGLSLAA